MLRLTEGASLLGPSNRAPWHPWMVPSPCPRPEFDGGRNKDRKQREEGAAPRSCICEVTDRQVRSRHPDLFSCDPRGPQPIPGSAEDWCMNVLPNNSTAITIFPDHPQSRVCTAQSLTRASIDTQAASALNDPIRWKCVMIFSEIGLDLIPDPSGSTWAGQIKAETLPLPCHSPSPGISKI